jgi:octaprenyl-diphosphate synthase
MEMLAVESKLAATPAACPPPIPTPGWPQIIQSAEPFLQGVAERLAAQAAEFEPQIVSYAQYALAAQGKQLRPVLVALSAEAAGEVNDSHLTVAVIIEMVHLATLVHDDIIDEATLRRGRPSMAANWGAEISVLLGDCLFAHALKLAASFPTPDICREVASATNTVCAGEILQTRGRGNFDVTLSHYFKVLGMKTAELFALSCQLSGFLSNASAARREALRQYGMALGTAYQLYDDCLDVLGSEAAAGKSLGADLAKGKMTLPLLIVRDRATQTDLNKLRGWLSKWEPERLSSVVGLIEKYDAFEESRSVIQRYLASARQALTALPESDGQAKLAGLTYFLAEQTAALGVGYV